MKLLNVGTDKMILENGSDVQKRFIEYGKIVDELHVHVIGKGKEEVSIAPNVTLYPVRTWLQSIFKCISLIKEKDIDVIVSPDPFAKGWICVLLKLVTRRKMLLSVYGGNIFDPYWKKLSVKNFLYSFVGRIVFAYADAIQTDGLETVDELRKRYGNKVLWKIVVPANINSFLAIKRDKQQSNEKVKILFVGRLIVQKNIPLLIKVVKAFEDMPVEFIVVGDGPEKNLLKELKITHYEKQSREEMVERFREADIFILTSAFEGFARVTMEAALAGIPVVTTNVSGVKGMVENGHTGYIINQGDEKGFIDALKHLVDNRDIRESMGTTIRDKARLILSTEYMIQRQKEVYDYLK